MLELRKFRFLVPHIRSLKVSLPSNKEKAGHTEQLITLFRSVREVKTQGKLLPPRLERKKVSIGSPGLGKQRLVSRNGHRTQHQDEKT